MLAEEVLTTLWEKPKLVALFDLPDTTLLMPGQILENEYRITRFLGRNPFCQVFLAEQESNDQQAIIKVILPEFTTLPGFEKRFYGVAEQMAKLSDPSLESVIDYGEDEEIFYIVTPPIAGKTLEDTLLEGNFSRNDWALLIQSCSEALEIVHDNRLIHGDIQPSSIWLTDEGKTILADTGFREICQDIESPEYPDNVHRTDIYSLAAVFCEMMTGQNPVSGSGVPSVIETGISTDCDQVLGKALSTEKDDQYSSIIEFCDELLESIGESRKNRKPIQEFISDSRINLMRLLSSKNPSPESRMGLMNSAPAKTHNWIQKAFSSFSF